MPLLIPAGNASNWTGPTGNNTWLLAGREPALIDAGVGRPEHVDAVASALGGASLARILITHAHPDHADGIPVLIERWPDAVVVSRSALHAGSELAVDGALIPAGNRVVRVLETPGHAPDHLCFFDEATRDLFCGDLARNGGTIVIPAGKGGHLGQYLASLRRVRELRPLRMLPGHGSIIEDPIKLIDEYLAHRAERDRQILEAIESGATSADEIAHRVYGELPAWLRTAAAETVAAHLIKLREEGRLPVSSPVHSALLR